MNLFTTPEYSAKVELGHATYLELHRPLWVLEVLDLADATGDVPAE